MADPFPTLRSGHILRYPSTRLRRYATAVIRFGGDVEKRWPVARPLEGWRIGLRNIDGYDLAKIRDFWDSKKGAFDKAFEITIDALTSVNMMFTDDHFPMLESAQSPNRVSLTLQVRQVRKT